MPDNNRLGASCWYKTADIKDKCGISPGAWRCGKLRAWSTDHEEFETGPGPFPVGVIEDDEHETCHSIYVTRISFGISPPV